MKKLVMTVAVLACAASIVSAQTVTSANMVGYAKFDAVGGQLTLVGVNFETGGATVVDLIGDQLPGGSKLYIWDKSANTYIPVAKGLFGWSPGATVLDNGDALWVESGAVAGVTNEVVFSGEVLLSKTNSVAMSGLDCTAYFYPVETLWGDTDLQVQLGTGSKLYVWNGDSYDPYTKGLFGWGAGLNVIIGPTTGFWVESAGAITWEETRPFTP